jgi:hypothetical protein
MNEFITWYWNNQGIAHIYKAYLKLYQFYFIFIPFLIEII